MKKRSQRSSTANPRLSERDDLLPFLVEVTIHRAAHGPSLRTFATHAEAEAWARHASNYYGTAAFLHVQSPDDPQEYDIAETYTPDPKVKSWRTNPARAREAYLLRGIA